jgi:CheY-like chemotaxis protein
MADLLLDEGCSVEVARDIPSAIRALKRAPADVCLILLDMMLPKGSGLDVVAHLQTTGRSTPVVALSAAPDRLLAAQRAGVSATIPKPFELEQIIDAVVHYCTAALSAPAAPPADGAAAGPPTLPAAHGSALSAAHGRARA